MKVLKFGGTSVGSVDRRDHGQTAEDSLDGDERRRSL